MNRNHEMKSIVMLTFVAVLCATRESYGQPVAAKPSQDAAISIIGRNSNFLVKLTSSMSAKSNQPGDPVTGVVIDPVPFRGGRLEGTIDRADRSFLDFSFHTLRFRDRTYRIRSAVTSLVSSKGNAGQDDLGQRVRFVGNGLIAYGTTTAVDEGAEVRFVAWQEQ